jgi:chitin disaccharide deacetylase
MLHTIRCALRWLLFAGVVAAQSSGAGARPAPPTLQEQLGYPANARLLIIHADDFGMAHSVNRAISEALENHWVTSASMMVPCPWFPEAAAWARAHPTADVGIHLVLDSEWATFRWGPVAPSDRVSSLLDRDGYFFDDPSLFTHVKLSDVETELHAQIDKARSQGVHLSHLDSHMVALVSTRSLYGVYRQLGRDYDLPIALVKNNSPRMPDGVEPPAGALALDEVITMSPGIPPNQWVSWYEKQLSSLKPGIYQLIVHLAYDDEEMRGATFGHPDWGAAWRQRDFDMVRSAEFQRFLRQQKFTLVTWGELSKAYRAHVRSEGRGSPSFQ